MSDTQQHRLLLKITGDCSVMLYMRTSINVPRGTHVGTQVVQIDQHEPHLWFKGSRTRLDDLYTEIAVVCFSCTKIQWHFEIQFLFSI